MHTLLVVLLLARSATALVSAINGLYCDGTTDVLQIDVRRSVTLEMRGSADNCTATYFPSIVAARGHDGYRVLFKRYDFAAMRDLPWLVGTLSSNGWRPERAAWPNGADVRVVPAQGCAPLHVMHVGGAHTESVRVHLWDADAGARPLVIGGRALQKWEKNWTPFAHATLPCEYVYFLYSIDPLSVLLCARASGHCRIEQGGMGARAGLLRGGTPLARHQRFPGLLLGLAHSTYVPDNDATLLGGKNGVHRPFIYVVQDGAANGTYRLVAVAGPLDLSVVAPAARACRATRPSAAPERIDARRRTLSDALVQDPVSLLLDGDGDGDCAVATFSVQPRIKSDSFGVLATLCGLHAIMERAQLAAEAPAPKHAPDWQRFVAHQLAAWWRQFVPRDLCGAQVQDRAERDPARPAGGPGRSPGSCASRNSRGVLKTQ